MASGTGSFKDRSARLVVFGVVAACLGLASFGLGVLQSALIFAGRLLPGSEALPTDAASYLSGTLVYFLVGLAFVSVGIGSIRKRRWVRPLMLTLAWSWLACGLLLAVLAPLFLDALLVASPNPAPVEAMVLVKLFLLCLIGFGGVLLPAAFVWAYSDPDVFRTCAALDPRPAWTERVPGPVLGLSAGLAACAVVALPLLLRPVVPAFAVVLTGWPAGLAILAGSAACAYLARSTYRLEPSGFWGTVALMLLIGVATTVSLATLEPAALFGALGYAKMEPYSPEGPDSPTFGPAAWAAVVVTLLSLLYMASIHRHFIRRRRS